MMGCRATPIQRMYKQSRKPLPRCKHDTASNMPTNSNVALHFIGVGGSGMSALALVALSQVSTMCTALGIFKSRVSAGLPCLWIRFVEVSATCASRSKGYNICTKLRWFSISTKNCRGLHALLVTPRRMLGRKKVFHQSRRLFQVCFLLVLRHDFVSD